MVDADWLIVGGGVHGVHVAARLIGEGEVSSERVRIVDPGAQLLARWRACTAVTGMSHLRSPAVHNIDITPPMLRRFAHENGQPHTFARPYDRPALAVFNAHCDDVITRFGLTERHLQDRVVGCDIDCEGVVVNCRENGSLRAANVVLAIGASEQPHIPEWATHSRCVHHIFDPCFDGWPQHPETVAVIGGGISAAQVAIRLVGEGHDVTVISRHQPRLHQFDSDPGWLGPRFMNKFGRLLDPDERRQTISAARNRGSITPELGRDIRRAVQSETLSWHIGEVALFTASDTPALTLVDGTVLGVDRVLLATGFEPQRPGGAMVDELIQSAHLPCAACGYPVTDDSLRWHPRIFVTGPLAELMLGPSARNIAGARRAGDRVISAVREQRVAA